MANDFGKARGVAQFENVVDEYDLGRPEHPEAVYDALGDLNGLVVLDVGAGTGIATRELIARGGSVVALDAGQAVLRRAAERTASLPAVVADGSRLPIQTGSVDLVCFAQSWHWLDPSTRVAESRRVLRANGRWAAWWSHARGDGEPWFDRYWQLIERACDGTHRGQRDTDWGATVDGDLFEVGDRVTVAWTRDMSIDAWITDQASHSYVAALSEAARVELLDGLHTAATDYFPGATMQIPYETWLWVAVCESG